MQRYCNGCRPAEVTVLFTSSTLSGASGMKLSTFFSCRQQGMVNALFTQWSQDEPSRLTAIAGYVVFSLTNPVADAATGKFVACNG